MDVVGLWFLEMGVDGWIEVGIFDVFSGVVRVIVFVAFVDLHVARGTKGDGDQWLCYFYKFVNLCYKNVIVFIILVIV